MKKYVLNRWKVIKVLLFGKRLKGVMMRYSFDHNHFIINYRGKQYHIQVTEHYRDDYES